MESVESLWSDLVSKAVKDMPDVSQADRKVYQETAQDKIASELLDVKSVLGGNFHPAFHLER